MIAPACSPRASDDVTVLRVAADLLTEDSLRGALRLGDAPGRRRLHLYLSGVGIPTAAGLGALVALDRTLRRRSGHLAVLNVGPWAYEVFAATRLAELLDVRAARRPRD